MLLQVLVKDPGMSSDSASIKADISIGSLDKPELMARILDFSGRFKFDFTRSYLQEKSVNELRHLLSAAVQVNI